MSFDSTATRSLSSRKRTIPNDSDGNPVNAHPSKKAKSTAEHLKKTATSLKHVQAQKAKPKKSTTTAPSAQIPPARRPPVQIEDISDDEEEQVRRHPVPRNPDRIIESMDEDEEVIDVDDNEEAAEEDAEAELSSRLLDLKEKN